MKIVLASNSPRRKELLARYGYEFEVIPSHIEETLDSNLSPKENVKNLAKSKCLDVYKNNADKVVIGADTIVVYQNEIFGKPNDRNHAFEMLKKLQGNIHEVMTGICIIGNNKIYNEVVVSQVEFYPMSDEEINEYIATKEPNDKAGAYAIQGIGGKYIKRFIGDYDNIVGLPIGLVDQILKKII